MAKSKNKSKPQQQSTITTKASSHQINPGVWLVTTFVVTLIVNMVVITAAHRLFPAHLVLGTLSVTPFWATLLNASVIALVTTFVFPFLDDIADRMGREWSPIEMMGIYFVLNFITVWLLGRNALVFGMGVTSWFVVFVLSAVLDVAQGSVMTALQKMR